MSLIKDFRSYLLEEELKINIYMNHVNIINYVHIDHFDNNSIIVRHNKGFIHVKGENLVVTKLINTELLIEGKIKSVELK